MFLKHFAAIGLVSLVGLVGCGDDDEGGKKNNTTGGSGGSSSTTGGTGGTNATGGSSTTGGTGGTSATTGGTGGTSATTGGTGGTGTAGTGGTNATGGTGGTGAGTLTCSEEDIKAKLKYGAAVTEGVVTLISDEDGVATLHIDAVAGGGAPGSDSFSKSSTYLKLSDFSQVDISDVQAYTSADWDISFHRTSIYANSGFAGPGSVEVAKLSKAFADVSDADIAGATFKQDDEYFLPPCEWNSDPDSFGAKPITGFDGWYSYPAGLTIVPNTTFLVRTGADTIYKLEVADYWGKTDGTSGGASGNFIIKVSEL